jgi:hypothetical protein
MDWLYVLNCCGFQKQSVRPVNGVAVNMTAFVDNAEVLALPWHYKGQLLVDVNRELLQRADAAGRSKTITLVSGLFDLGRGDLPSGTLCKRRAPVMQATVSSACTCVDAYTPLTSTRPMPHPFCGRWRL